MNVVNANITRQRDVAKPVFKTVLRTEVYMSGARREFCGEATGTLAALWKNPNTVTGIWVDRLEEYPEEVSGIPTEVLPKVIAHLRTMC